MKAYSRQEVFDAGLEGKAWIIIFDKVFDLESFLMEHPGGDIILREYFGLDATDPFLDAEHSDEAVKMMSQYCIGKLSDPIDK